MKGWEAGVGWIQQSTHGLVDVTLPQRGSALKLRARFQSIAISKK